MPFGPDSHGGCFNLDLPAVRGVVRGLTARHAVERITEATDEEVETSEEIMPHDHVPPGQSVLCLLGCMAPLVVVLLVVAAKIRSLWNNRALQ